VISRFIWLTKKPPTRKLEKREPKFTRKNKGLQVRETALESPSSPPLGVAIAAIVRNEAHYIREWLEFHLLVGISRFYIYDNGSDDDLMSVLDAYVVAGHVRVIPWKGFVHQVNTQNLAYAHAIANVDADIGWVSLLDIDEFLFSPTGASLVEVLTNQPPHAALAVKRVEFGPGQHIKRPQGMLIDNYRMCSRLSDRVKSIVRPWTVKVVGVHRCECEGPYMFPSPAVLRVNHYFTKSREEFESKLRRGYGWLLDVSAKKFARSMGLFSATVPDDAILIFADRLKMRMEPRPPERGTD
jgi:hypothetical protein